MSENNNQPFANLNALAELDKIKFRGLAIEVREARRRAEDLLDRLSVLKDGFLIKEMEKEAAEKAAQAEQAAVEVAIESVSISEEPSVPEAVIPEPVPEQTTAEDLPVKEEVQESAPAQAEAQPSESAVNEEQLARNPLRPDVPEPRKFKPIVYIPESERLGPKGGRPSFGQNRPFAPRDAGFGFRDADKPMFVPPQPAGKGKGGKKVFEKGNYYNSYEEKKGPNKRDIMRRELENGKEIDDSEIARRFKSKKYQKQSHAIQQTVIEKAIITTDPVPVKTLSEKIGKTGADIIGKLLMLGIMKTINDSIDFETAELVASDYGITLELKADKSAEEKLEEIITDASEAQNTEPRAPIVTIMGHVDHGKTSLLDRIRNTSVAAGEAGGITQHIGAYTIEKDGHMITFIDTPGHEAFTSMRARGAMVTDVAIIVVAADDSIMPQTIEAINHAKAAKVPIIVAINKIDKPGANIAKVKSDLLQYDVVVEEYGGEVIACPVSAKTGEGVDNLLESINLFVDTLIQPMANSKLPARGTVIEAKVDKSGPLATILVQNGTLKIGDYMVAGSTYGKVKMMTNDKGKSVRTAGPSVPVSVLGFVEAPSAGDQMVVLQDEKLAKKIAEERKLKIKEGENTSNRKNVEDLFRQINEGNTKTMNLIVKADVQGSLEALVQELTKLSNDEVKVKVIHKGVGNVNDSDMILAKTSEATIIVFNQKETNAIKDAANKMGVDIKWYKVIYNLLDDIDLAMKGMLAPVYQETFLGRAEVREVFKISGVGLIAGCRVMEGKLQRNAKARVIRGDEVMVDGTISSLKRLKDDVKEVQTGFECGVGIEDFSDIKAGDVIECYMMEEVAAE